VTIWAENDPTPPVAGLGRLGAVVLTCLVLVFSQAWVFPVFGEKLNPSASAIVRNTFVPAYLAAIVMVLGAPWRTVGALVRQPFLIMLMLIVALSALWSVAPDLTLRRTVALYATTMGGVALAVRCRWSELAEVLATAYAVLVVISILLAVLVPSIGIMHEIFPGAWRGPWAEKNQLGGNMGQGFCILGAAAFLNPKRAKMWFGFAILAFALILMSTSKTSLVSALLGMGALTFILMVRQGPTLGVTTTWFAVLGVVMIGGLLFFASDVFFDLLGKDATLTGRTKIWESIMRRIADRPWTGYGYSVVWDQEGAWGILAWIVHDSHFKPQHAHNAWLEQWLGLGLGGLVIFALTYAQTMINAIVAVYRHKGAYLALPFLVVYFLMSMTESIAVIYNDFRWVIFTAIAIKLTMPEPKDFY
jgi:exopolysaccharide production protein ExoQ